MANGRVIALGFFDGVHLGHAALLNKVNERAAEKGLSPAVLSFDVHPDKLVFGGEVELINTPEEKKWLVCSLFGIEDVIFLRFTDDLMHMDWQTFIELLISRFDVQHIVVGHDFSFGWRGEGSPDKLQVYCAEHGLGCDVIPPVVLDGCIVSSTHIRRLIAEGSIEQANRYLGHRLSLSGTVVHGLHNGEKLGFPTINIKMPAELLVPKFGVYASLVHTEHGDFHAATDIGVKPTVCSDSEVLVESHLLDFSGDIYGETVRVELCRFQRPEMHFSSLQELSDTIAKDISDIRAYFQE